MACYIFKNTPMKQKIKRDGAARSLWQDISVQPAYSTSYERAYDVLIIGGGITGVSTAFILQKQGKKCLLVDAHNIGFGTTGGTSAHLNTFFDLTYPEIDSKFSEEASKQMAILGRQAIDTIERFIKEHHIDCDFEYKAGILFSQDEKESKQLLEVLRSSQQAGIGVEEISDPGLPIPFERAIKFEKQAQFHPLKYITALAKAYSSLGGHIMEGAPASAPQAIAEGYKVDCGGQEITATDIVYATHIPPGVNRFSFTCAPYRSYIVAAELENGSYPEVLAYDMKEPYHYYRSHTVDGRRYLIAGGEDHKTSQGDPTEAFKTLEEHVRKYFAVKSVAFCWSSQYYVPADGLPYIGLMPGEKGIYVATGYNGNGMIFGTAASQIISDLILKMESPYSELLSPSRVKPLAAAADFVTENANVAWHFIADRMGTGKDDLFISVEAGQGKIVEHEGSKVAAYRYDNKKLVTLNPTCSHAGCIVKFNQEERAWECPCHGGRFSVEGKVLTGPARKDLEPIHLKR